MLFARYAKKLVQVAHSPPESDGMIGKCAGGTFTTGK